jgi:hypothetical protein
MPGNAAFHPTIKTVGFQTAFSVILVRRPFVRFTHDPVKRIEEVQFSDVSCF